MQRSSHLITSLYLGCTVAIGIAVVAVAIGLSVAGPAGTPLRVISAGGGRQSLAAGIPGCTAEPLPWGSSVGGLGGAAVPRFPRSTRLNYDDSGFTRYEVSASGAAVLRFYAQELADQCWQVRELASHAGVWAKGEAGLRIAVAENPSGSSTVDYQLVRGQVLSATFTAATHEDTCAAGTTMCVGYGCLATGSPCPPGGTTAVSCIAGQISCTAGNGTSYCYTSTGYCPTSPVPCTSPLPSCPADVIGSSGTPYVFDGNGCPVGCAAPTCTGSYTGTGAPGTCNSTTCPSGCTYDPTTSCAIGCVTTTSPSSCPSPKLWCSTSSGVFCMDAPCPLACASGQILCTAGNGTSYCYTSTGYCPTSPVPCTTPLPSCSSGSYTFDGSGCPTGCAQQPTCSGTYQTPGVTSPSCYYSSCPNGCTWGSDGCPNGCAQQPTCSGEYQQPGATSPSCNFTKCPSGCNWTNGCPTSCYPTQQTSCSGEFQQPGSTWPTCNYTKCPSGCTWTNGCPSGCSTPPTCSGTYQTPGVTSPSCYYSSCPNGCTWGSDGCPNGCAASGGGGSTGTTRQSCESGGGLWCQPTTAPHCHPGPNPMACEPDTVSGGGGTACPGGFWCPSSNSCVPSGSPCGTGGGTVCAIGSFMCNSTCVPNGTPCTWTPGPATTCPNGFTWCSTSNSCIAAGSTCGNPAPTCAAPKYLCNGSCVEPGTPCGGVTPPPPGGGRCLNGFYWCALTASCLSVNQPCSESPTPVPPPSLCPANFYWCPQEGSCKPLESPCGNPSPPPPTPTPDPGPDPLPPGPSEEELKRMLEEMRKSVPQMRREFKRVVQREADAAQRTFKRCGINPMPEYFAALGGFEQLLGKLEAAASFEEGKLIMEELMEAGRTIEEGTRNLHRYKELCQQKREIPRAAKALERDFSRQKGPANRSGSDQIVAYLKELEAHVVALRALSGEFLKLLGSDPEQALERVEDFWSRMDEARDLHWLLERAINARKSVGLLRRDERNLAAEIRRYRRAGEDVTEAEALLERFTEAIAEVGRAIKEKADLAEVIDLIEAAHDARLDLDVVLDELRGRSEHEVIRREKVIEYQLPDAFKSQPQTSTAAPKG